MMKISSEDWLRQACADLAREETEALEKSLNRADIRRAEGLFQKHKRFALSLIAQNMKKKRPSGVYWKLAACLALITGAVYFSLFQNHLDPVPLSPLPSASVAPFITSEPTFSPSPVPSPSPAPYPTTFEENLDVIHTPAPTILEISKKDGMPGITDGQREQDVSLALPTASPRPTLTPTPVPTDAPSPQPTLTPTPVSQADSLADQLTRQNWTGSCYLSYLPAGYMLSAVEQRDGYHRAVYESENDRITFIEYDADELIALPQEQIEAPAYAAIDTGSAALKMAVQDGTLYAWSQWGHSFSLLTDEEDGIEIVKSLKKF